MPLATYLSNPTDVTARITGITDKVRDRLRNGVGRLALKAQTIVKTQKLMGQVLNKRTGRLAGSVQQATFDEGDNIVGRVSTNVFYGVGWELGWPDRQPSLGSAKSKFSVGGSDMFANGTPKKRSFLASSLKDLQDSGAIKEEIDAAIAGALQ